MKKLFLLLLITSFSVVSSQNINLTAIEINSFKFEGDEFLGYDAFGFYYSITNNVFSKVGMNTNLEYKNVSLGKITKVDLQNPLKIILFYSDFNTAIILDNQLNEIQKINFSDFSIPIVTTAIGLSSQNNLWLYNSMNQQLGLYDYLKNEYKTISVPFSETIKQYTSDFNFFSWIDSKNNWYTSDIFGAVNFRVNVTEFDQIQIISKSQFIYSKLGILILKDLEKNKSYEIKISQKSFEKFYYKDQILSIFTSEGITNYKIIIP